MNMKVLIALIIGVCIVAAAGIIAFGMMNSHETVVINATNSTNTTNGTNGTNITNMTNSTVEHVNHEDTSTHEATTTSKSGSNSQDDLQATLAEGRSNMPAEVRARYDAREEAFASGNYRQADYIHS